MCVCVCVCVSHVYVCVCVCLCVCVYGLRVRAVCIRVYGHGRAPGRYRNVLVRGAEEMHLDGAWLAKLKALPVYTPPADVMAARARQVRRPVTERQHEVPMGNLYQFLDFVNSSTRTEGPHGGASYAQTSERNRIDRHPRCIERLFQGPPVPPLVLRAIPAPGACVRVATTHAWGAWWRPCSRNQPHRWRPPF